MEYIIKGKKYISFIKTFGNNEIKNIKISDDKLIKSYYEDRIHNLYLKLISSLEENIINELNLKKKSMIFFMNIFRKLLFEWIK